MKWKSNLFSTTKYWISTSFYTITNKTEFHSKNLPISCISNNRQPRQLSQNARRRAINQTNQQKQKHSAIQTHHQIQPNPTFWIKTSFQKVRKNQQHIKHNSLHCIESHISTEIRVSDNKKVKGQKHKKPIKGETLKNPNCRNQWLNNGLNRVELSDNKFSILYTIKKGVEVTKGGN